MMIMMMMIMMMMMMMVMTETLKDATLDCLESTHCAVKCLQHAHTHGHGAIMYK